MVHAEKIVIAVQRGVANTRWRDFRRRVRSQHPDVESAPAAMGEVTPWFGVSAAAPADPGEGSPDSVRNQDRGMWPSVVRVRGWRGLSSPPDRRAAR
jgi:hypothetical protein